MRLGTRMSQVAGGWFVYEGEAAILAHIDTSCSVYDIIINEVSFYHWLFQTIILVCFVFGSISCEKKLCFWSHFSNLAYFVLFTIVSKFERREELLLMNISDPIFFHLCFRQSNVGKKMLQQTFESQNTRETNLQWATTNKGVKELYHG